MHHYGDHNMNLGHNWDSNQLPLGKYHYNPKNCSLAKFYASLINPKKHLVLKLIIKSMGGDQPLISVNKAQPWGE
jgi:hypothetical protein